MCQIEPFNRPESDVSSSFYVVGKSPIMCGRRKSYAIKKETIHSMTSGKKEEIFTGVHGSPWERLVGNHSRIFGGQS